MKRARLLLVPALLIFAALTSSCGSNSNIQGCSGCRFVYATTNSSEVLTFSTDAVLGTLGAPMSIAGPPNSTGILINNLTLYVSDPGNSAVRAYAVSSNDGSLSPASFGPYPVTSTPGAIAALPDGSTLYVASSTGSIFAFTMNVDGSLSSVTGSPFSAGQGLSHLTVSYSGTADFLYASSPTDPNGGIWSFSISSNGALVPVAGSPFPTVPNGGPEALCQFQNFVYVALKNMNSVAGFTINTDGSLTALAGSPYAAGRGTSSVVCDAIGFVFATNNLDGTVSSYSINQVSGVLTEVSGSPFTAAVPSGDLYEDRTGTLWLPNAASNAINGFAPDSNTGAVNALMGSPFYAGFGPLALTGTIFPVIDPP